MQEKIVLITGATSGVGLATAQGLAELGATLVLVGRDAAKCQVEPLSMGDNSTHRNGTPVLRDGQPRRLALS